MVELVQPGGSGSGTALTVTDGSTTVTDVSEIDFDGAVVTDLGGGVVQVTVSPSGADQILSTTSVDFSSTGTTNLYTVPVGKIAIITGAIIRPTSASGVVSTPRAGIGVAAGEDDMFSSTDLTGLTDVGEVFQFKAIGVNVVGNAGDIIKIGVDVAV